MSGTFDRIVFGIAIVVALPALIAGAGFYLAGALVVAILVGAYGGREGLDFLKKQHIGSKAGRRQRDMQDYISSGGTDSSDKKWGRE